MTSPTVSKGKLADTHSWCILHTIDALTTSSIYRLSLRISLKQAEIICMQFGCSSLATLAELEHVALKNLLVCWLVSRIVDANGRPDCKMCWILPAIVIREIA